MSDYKRWYELQSNNYMKSLDEIEKLKEKNAILEEVVAEVSCELSDEQLEHVIGGMQEGRWKIYKTDLVNEHRRLKTKS